MTTPLSFNFLPHRREFLQTTIGTKLRGDFAFNSFTPIPKVRLFTPDEARKAGFDPNRGLGWFNFKTTEIGVLVFNNRPAFQAWQMATGVTVHEHLHWLWSLSPITVGCQNETDRFVMNVFTDGANEQRALLESRWSGRFLRRTRQMLLPNAWPQFDQDPLYRAGYFTLAVHTLLSVRGGRILRRLHNSKDPKSMARELWALCEKEFKRQLPADQMDLWLSAFGLCLQAWTADSDFTRFSIAQDFIALFPPPLQAPPDNPLDLGGHMNDDCERVDGPAGKSKSGKAIKSNQLPAGGEGASADSPQDQKDEPKSDETGNAPADNPADNPEPESSPLSFDEATGPDKDDQDEISAVEKETRELNQPSQILPGAVLPKLTMPGAVVRDMPAEKVNPVDPSSLVASAQKDANTLAERLRIVARPRGRVQASRGRVVTRIVAHDPAAAKPFRNRVAPVKGFDPKVFVGMVCDTSGSMRSRKKAEASKQAAMTVHLACARENVAHWIITSRTLEMLAGKGISMEKGNALIAGMYPASGGDNYINVLPGIINLVLKRPEHIKVLLILTDGAPGAKESLKPMIDQARKQGVIIVGIGLELNETETLGMKVIFGDGPDQTVIAKSSGFAALTAEVLSNAVTRGSRFG